jgi:hypothetical protein
MLWLKLENNTLKILNFTNNAIFVNKRFIQLLFLLQGTNAVITLLLWHVGFVNAIYFSLCKWITIGILNI